MSRQRDALELLLPDADDHALLRARDVTRFLRLLSDDAAPERAGTVGVDLDRARGELDRTDRADIEAALVLLVRAHLAALLPPESFAWFGADSGPAHAAWRCLSEFDDVLGGRGRTPDPTEPLVDVARRLLGDLEWLGTAPARLGLWQARLAHVAGGPRAGERAHRAALAGFEAEPRALPNAREHLAGLIEALLDRGAVREARNVLGEHLARLGTDARLRQLSAWVRLGLGDAAGSRAALVGLPPWTGRLPATLVELRAHRPEWLPCLAGKTPPAGARIETGADAPERVETLRQDLGALAVAVIAFHPAHGARVLALDVAPGSKERRAAWTAERLDAFGSPGTVEHQVVGTARSVVRHADPEGRVVGALGGDATRALAVAPVLDGEGEVAGWLHVECEHHLLPSSARCAAIARAWRSDVLAQRGAEPDASPNGTECGARDVRLAAEPASDPRAAAVFQALVLDLGIKLHLRHWWGFTLRGEEPVLVETGGEGVGLARSRPGRGRALARALATGGPVVVEEPDERLSILADSASTVVVPLAVLGRGVGLLVVESSRRRDFKPKDVEAWSARLPSHALALRMAQFRAWHARRFGVPACWSADAPGFADFAAYSLKAARAREAVAIRGPRGAGKGVVARWLHFEGARPEGPFQVFSCGAPLSACAGFGRLLAAARGGTLVLDDVERLAPALQDEVVRWLDGLERGPARDRDGPVPRLLATTTRGLLEAAAAGDLRHDLARRLDRWTLCVPSLAERRGEIPSLVAEMARRFADEEGLEPPTFTDEALALLWRQPWEGNVRELENVVYKLALQRPGTAVTPGDVLALGATFGLQLLRKLPSRHPDRRDLASALWTTRKACGRANKTRAALYLGWDPDTLVTRLASTGLDAERVDLGPGWTSAPAEGPDRVPAEEEAAVEALAEDDPDA